MRTISAILMGLLCGISLVAQEKFHEDYHDLCSRTQVASPVQPPPISNHDEISGRPACSISDMGTIAAMDTSQLLQYLMSGDEAINCINRTIYGFHSSHSPLLFSEDKVQFVAHHAEELAVEFDGTNSEILGLFVYLSNAAHQANFYSQVSFAKAIWGDIQSACASFAGNANSLAQTEVSMYTMGHMYFAASFDTIGVHPDIIQGAHRLLDNIANDSYQGLPNFYPYYYSYYYLLDVFLRYNSNYKDFIDGLVDQDSTLLSLGDAATNLNLNADTYQFFDELSNHSVVALTRYAPYPQLHHVVEHALNQVADSYDEFSNRWVHAALALVRNGLPFLYSEEDIIGNLEETLFPHNFVFEDGRFQISTPLSYEEILPLYQGILEVRAQFYQLIRTSEPIAGDNNDTLFVKLHGSRASYQDFNDVLFGINYPNAGGVYIEHYGTFYTYQREEGESTYSMEELFRHEYAHLPPGEIPRAGIMG